MGVNQLPQACPEMPGHACRGASAEPEAAQSLPERNCCWAAWLDALPPEVRSGTVSATPCNQLWRVLPVRSTPPLPAGIHRRGTHPGWAAELAAYCKTLAWVGREYFGRLGQDFGSMGLLIVAGIKPGKRIRLWSEQVDGHLTPDVWQVFVELLEGAGQNVLPTVSGSVACALECLLGAGPLTGFPVGPSI
jgi:hypothetical protein